MPEPPGIYFPQGSAAAHKRSYSSSSSRSLAYSERRMHDADLKEIAAVVRATRARDADMRREDRHHHSDM